MIRARVTIVAVLLIAAVPCANARRLDLPLFRIDVPSGWTHSIEEGTARGWGDLVILRPTHKDGRLKILSYRAPVVITEERLRNMTNVDAGQHLTWQRWGGFSGYHYAYEELGSSYIQWFLVNGKTLLLATYQGDPVSTNTVAKDLDQMIDSLEMNPPH